MEPKLIKEENGEKDGGQGYAETPRTRAKAASKDRCKTPDSPEGARQAAAPLSPTQSSPPRHPTNGTSSPVNNGSADSLTPPLPASTVLSVNLDNAQPQQYHGSYSNVTRPLVKVKRFLSTLVQFGCDIGPDIGERVRSLVLNLVSSNLSIEEFHHSLQDVTNFPLRPFVLPFLRTHLPLLQREIHALARANKQSPLQYVRSHDHVILDSTHSPSELSEIFMSNETPLVAGLKRRASDSIYENGTNGQPHDPQDCLSIKRPMNSQNAFLFSHQSLLLPNMSSTIPNSHFFDYNQHNHLPQRVEDNNNTPNRGDEEWRNIHVMLNCILSMVEKTKRALTILQQRNSQDLTNEWLRKQDVSVDLKKAANEIMVQAVRQTEDRVAEVRRRAEDAVNDVKRQAVIELQKAVAAAETKANELVAAERAKMEKLLAEARKHGDENQDNPDNSLSPPASQPQPSQQNSCWNCGRKAHETCSGCSVARYCGPFCQHKDWENHHQICSKEKAMRPLRTSTPSTTAPPTHVNQSETVKFKK
ncbi:Protein CBFA2T3-like Protein [Tribolium castaneum]|uniref:Protein CBFA2T3-like Protein n=2 Tax=Tribolium castaneum TaxID=7070 RepID=A0A139WEF7_TRICA|nr:Protein CBFA2T3-like Protein [Tribolium castaneum]